MRSTIVDDDLRHTLQLTKDLWEKLRGTRIFVTGGTGFFGTPLLESFALANQLLKLEALVVVLSRNPAAFKTQQPHLANDPAIRFHAGDVQTFDFPEGPFNYVIHGAATSARETFQNADVVRKFDTVVGGTRRVLEFAAACGASKVLYTSSGVVYGHQPADITRIPEDYPGAPATTNTATLSAWGSTKRAAEFLCACYAEKYGFQVKVARCFSFAGTGLPLDIHYAIGNFIRDGLRGGPIQILGDGTPRRSYLYSADLTAWLWTILLKGASLHPYNVGSEEDMSIAEVARLVAESFPGVELRIAQSPTPGSPLERYVPSTARARTELGVKETVNLKEAIRRMIAHHQHGIAAGLNNFRPE